MDKTKEAKEEFARELEHQLTGDSKSSWFRTTVAMFKLSMKGQPTGIKVLCWFLGVLSTVVTIVVLLPIMLPLNAAAHAGVWLSDTVDKVFPRG